MPPPRGEIPTAAETLSPVHGQRYEAHANNGVCPRGSFGKGDLVASVATGREPDIIFGTIRRL